MEMGWQEMSSYEIQEAVNGFLITGNPESMVKGLSTDSRIVEDGELFWPIRGTIYDGHDFVLKALDIGASGIVIEKRKWESSSEIRNELKKRFNDRFVITVEDTIKALGDFAAWWRRKSDAEVAVITGSAGKTTTKEMAAGILSLKSKTLKNKGNLNNLIGLPLTLLSLNFEHEKAVLEMGMNHAGEIRRLTEIAEPDLGLITNVGMAHLEGVGDLSGVARAKAEMVEQMSPESQVIVNGDDDVLTKTVTALRKDVITFGLDKNRDVYAYGIRNLGLKGTEFRLIHKGGSFPVRINEPGVQNVLNALAAATICLGFNVPEEDIVAGLGAFTGVKGRFKIIDLPGGNILVDDTYNANPMSLEAALKSVDVIGKGRKIIIGMGEMLELGNASGKAHLKAGKDIAGLNPEYFIAIGEHAHEMITGARDGGMNKGRTLMAENHENMVKLIKDKMGTGSLILLKGSRGMQLDKVAGALADT